MLTPEPPDRIHIAFDDHRLVANAGLLLPFTLAHHLGVGKLADKHVDLGNVPGRANAGGKVLTLVASALAGGDCINDAHALRAGSTNHVLGCVVKAPSTLATFLRSFRYGHVRQLDWMSRGFWPELGLLERDRVMVGRPSTLISPSARPLGWPRRTHSATTTPACGAIIRCWPSPLALVTC